MASDLTKRLDAMVKKKLKVSVTSARLSLKTSEDKIINAAMKLSDEFSVAKKDGKVSMIIYNRKPNVKGIVDELRKMITKMKHAEFTELKKILLECIVFLEKTSYIENAEKAKKGVMDYSKELDIYLKAFNELNELEKKSVHYSELVKNYSRKIDEDTKIMYEHSKSLNELLGIMRRSYDALKKLKEKNDNSLDSLQILILGEKIRRKGILELLGIRRILPEKKPEAKNEEPKKDDTNIGSKEGMKKDLEKENDYLPHDDKSETNSKIIRISGKFQTEIDELLRLVKEEGRVNFNKLARIYEEKIGTIEAWCEALEETGLISIHYPLFGSPYIKYENKEKKE